MTFCYLTYRILNVKNEHQIVPIHKNTIDLIALQYTLQTKATALPSEGMKQY